jgi:RNA polymerase primary sigma factor
LINVERYAHSATTRADLVQEGSAALFRAVDGFDWRRGLLFRTYAVHWLNQAFRNFLYNFTSTVRVPVYLQKAMKAIHQAQVRLGDANASPDQIAEIAEIDAGLVTSALGAARSSYSLDADFSDDGEGNRLRDLLVNDESDGPYNPGIEDVSLESGLGAALAKLSEREQQVLRLRFGIGRAGESTLAEVAEILGVSVERVRQIQVRAISKLDTPALRRELEPFLN